MDARGLGDAPFVADRESFVRRGIPTALYAVCEERGRILRRRAFAAASVKLGSLFLIEREGRGHDRSV